jgi:hypothetical protein
MVLKKELRVLYLDLEIEAARRRLSKPTSIVTHLLQQGHTYSNKAPWAKHIQTTTMCVCVCVLCTCVYVHLYICKYIYIIYI